MRDQFVSTTTPLGSEHNVWDRQVGESEKAHAAFLVYRDLGLDRRLSHVAQELSKSKQLMQKWSMRWNWRDRVLAWDRHVAEIEERETIKERVEFRKMSLMVAKNLATKAALGVQALKTVRKGSDNEEYLSIKPADLIRILELSYKMQDSLLGHNDEDQVAKIEVIFGATEDEEDDPVGGGPRS